jgi:hypothetical protein
MVFPDRPTGNAWQLIGQSFNQGAGIVNDLSTQQNALQALVERRTQAALEQKRLEREQAAKDWELQQKKEGEKRAKDSAEYAKGEIISPTLVMHPELAQSSQPMFQGGPSKAEVDALTLEQDQLPNQNIGSSDSTALMGQALDRSIANQNPGRVPRTREEIIQNLTENRQFDELGKYATATKPEADMYKWNNNPALLSDYQSKSQNDPTFQKISEGYARDPKKWGPALQRWGNQNGYSGQLWWNQEVDNMVHQSPIMPPQFNPQSALTQKFQQENTIRDEYKKGAEKFETAFPAYGKLQQALKRNNSTDAYSAVINFVRTLDPGSTVREAEERLARERSSGGLWGQLAQAFSNRASGKMTDEVRKNLLESGRGLIKQEYEQYNRVRDDSRAQTLNYPDPRGIDASLDTLNTIGQGRQGAYENTMSEDIFSNNPQPIPGVRVDTRPPEPIKKLGFSDAGKQARYEAWKKAHGK